MSSQEPGSLLPKSTPGAPSPQLERSSDQAQALEQVSVARESGTGAQDQWFGTSQIGDQELGSEQKRERFRELGRFADRHRVPEPNRFREHDRAHEQSRVRELAQMLETGGAQGDRNPNQKDGNTQQNLGFQKDGDVILVSCGEASGDLLAAGVVRELKAADPTLRIVGLGGPRCREAGMEVLWDISRLSVMGIGEVLPKLWSIWKLMREMVKAAQKLQPKAALLVDSPDFNLRLASRLKSRGVRVVQYVSPSVWLWRSGRTKQLARHVDEVCCILPFEEAWLKKRQVQARFVGHPLLELEPDEQALDELRSGVLGRSRAPVLLLLPGSRRYEVRHLLPVFAGAARRLSKDFPELEVVLALAPNVERSTAEALCEEAGFMPRIVTGHARQLLALADAALVASGTATLEATLAETPMVVAYRSSFLTEIVFRVFVRAPHVSLPNILAGREIVPERLQRELREDVLAELVAPLLSDSPQRSAMKADLAQVRASLGSPGAGRRVAEVVLNRALPPSVSPESRQLEKGGGGL